MSQSAKNEIIRQRRHAAILLSLLLVAVIALSLADNVLGVLGALAAPFWLPLCCYYVPLLTVKIYLVLGIILSMSAFPIAVASDFLALPEHFALAFGLTSVMLTFGFGLGLLVASSRDNQLPSDVL